MLMEAKELGLKSVHFFGNVAQKELRSVYNIADVNLVINDILSGKTTQSCDANGDGSVNIADVNFIIGRILGAQ